ncbi:hypothetical protein AcW1_000093 [Taiwanofungus camphoratus]|nr:hypothetical protein AcW1_000093 [Antrodia cinnamomea]
MGNAISKVKLLVAATIALRETYDLVSKRLNASPGLPVSNPTLPFWTIPLASIPTDAKPLPKVADVVVVGSGITGTSFVYNLLSYDSSARVVMLEARDVCSGATARNGGHVNPPLYHDYNDLKQKFGERAAKQMIKFRLAHLQEFMHIAASEDIVKESQCRETEHIDVFTCPVSFAEAKDNLVMWKSEMPVEASSFGYCEGRDAIEKYRLSEHTVGCIYGLGGAIHPYRFVTSLLLKLLDRHSDNFHLATQTPCTAIEPATSSSPFYTVITSKGTISTPHVIHATNGWCSYLLEPMRTKISPFRGIMSAQRPGTLLSSSTLDGHRSFVFYRGTSGYDYLTQLPTGEHELMFGGGWAQSCDGNLPDIGITDDSVYHFATASHLAGALPLYFGGGNWGGEKVPTEQEGVQWGIGRTKAQWSGILGISSDVLPWVGRLPPKLAGRAAPKAMGLGNPKKANPSLAAPGEWIAAGYTGEGMPHAWMCGKALAYMLLNREDEIQQWFPDILRVTEKRWKNAKIDDLLTRYLK